MIKKNQRLLNVILVAFDILLLILAFIIAWFLRFKTTLFDPIGNYLSFEKYLPIAIFIILLYILSYYFSGLYNPFRNKFNIISEAIQIIKVNILVFILSIAILFIIDQKDYSRLFLFFFALLSTIFVIIKIFIFRITLKHNRASYKNLENILIVGDGELANKFAAKIESKKYLNYSLGGFLGYNHETNHKIGNSKVIGKISQMKELLEKNKYDIVIMAIPIKYYDNLTKLIDICENQGVKTAIIPDYYKYIPAKPFVEMIDEFPIINIRQIPLDDILNRFIKKIFDIIIAIIAIIITSPVMFITAIMIKLTSSGSIIYKQERIGYKKKPFIMYKFRSMIVQDEDEEKSKWSTENDPRKTKVGNFIRRTNIDELPQFFNVLKGEMSIVGPRPERPYFVEKFRHDIPKYMIKHQIKPGITGLAQIHGYRGNTSIKKRIEYDIKYVENWYFGLDIQIIWKTITFLLSN